MDKKICKICKKELTIDLFGNSKVNKDKKENRCKICENERNKEKSKRQQKTFHGRAKNLFYNYRYKDKKNLLYNNLDIEFVKEKIKLNCEYCGTIEQIGLDRLDNTLGHLKENVISCCATCNLTRANNLTYDEMKLLGPIIYKIQEKRKIDGIPILKHLFKGLG